MAIYMVPCPIKQKVIMKYLFLFLPIILLTGCASTSPKLVHCNFEQDEKRLIKIQPIKNKTGDKKFDKTTSTLTGKLIDNIERSGKYKVIDARNKLPKDSKFQPDSEAIVSITKITYDIDCLFGLIAWVNTHSVEVDMNVRIIDIDNGDVFSTASVTEKAWVEEWVALYVFRLGTKKTEKQLEALAVDYALKSLANKL